MVDLSPLFASPSRRFSLRLLSFLQSIYSHLDAPLPMNLHIYARIGGRVRRMRVPNEGVKSWSEREWREVRTGDWFYLASGSKGVLSVLDVFDW